MGNCKKYGKNYVMHNPFSMYFSYTRRNDKNDTGKPECKFPTLQCPIHEHTKKRVIKQRVY